MNSDVVDPTKAPNPAGPSYGTARRTGQYLAAILSTISAFAMGNSMAWSSPAGPHMRNGTYIEGVELTDVEESWAGSLIPLGASVSAIPTGFIMDVIGRRRSLLALVIPYTVGWGLIIWPTSVEFLYLGRFLLGLAAGAVSVTAPIYTAEIAQVEIRGALCSWFTIMLNSGIVFVYAVGCGASIFVLSIVCGAVPLVFAAAFFFMPETPVFCVTKERVEEAKKALLFLRGPNYNIDAELFDIKDRIETAKREKTPLYKELTSRAVVRSFVIILVLMALQQLSGIDVTTYYGQSIFQAAHSHLSPGVSSTILGFILTASSYLSSLAMDKLGRKILLIVSTGVMSVCTFLLGLFFYLQESDHDVSAVEWLPLVVLCVYIWAYSTGLGPVPRVMVGELFLARLRGAASGTAVLTVWGTSFFVIRFFLDLVRVLGSGPTFWIFSAILAGGTTFGFFVVNETKGKTVEEIQEELGRR